jgi:hypothetical protein
MATKRVLKTAVVVSIAACSVIGGYCALVTSSKNGLFDSIANSVGRDDQQKYIPGGPTPIRTTFTGIKHVDTQLLTLVTFFAFLIDGPQAWNDTLSFWYLMAQLYAGWCLVVLEGRRKGNRGKAVSW